ncbi:MAG: YcjF family protein [Xanthobacteraceae bacterium]
MTNEATHRGAPPASESSRDKEAAKLVDYFCLWSGGAGLIPLPLVDMAAVGAVQLQMLRKLAALYDVRFSENLGKSVLASLVGALIPASSGMGLASMVKSVPLVGTVVSLVSMPVLSAGATYIIGRVFMQHFASGGTLLDFNPPDYREFIKEQTDRLKAKLDAPSGSSHASAASAPQNKGSKNPSV